MIDMEDLQRLYPIGIQTFSKIREGNYLYVDKTEYVYRMTHSASSYMFLSRPRRFGKSLLTSTLHSYFSGRKELFHGLAMEKLEKEWTEYPVLHFDMSTAKHADSEQLLQELNLKLYGYEQIYGRLEEEVNPNQRLMGLIKRAYEQTGKKVVVLIDEYDAPLLDVVHERENLDVLRNIMRNFYSPLKACDPYLRYVFLTGITKFSQLSIFSELNNIKNISMDEPYAAICGISEDEIRLQMKDDLGGLAKKLEITPEEALMKLKENYDGYHFTSPSPDIYNPFSLLNAFADGKFGSYWFGSGTPTYLVKMLDKFGVKPSEIGRRQLKSSVFDAPTETMTDAVPLLYQSGYITIKDYNKMLDLYTLDIPNKEVRLGLMESLLPYYVNNKTPEATTMVAYLFYDIQNGDMDAALHRLQEFLSTIPYCDNTRFEGHYQQVFYIIFSLLGYYVDVEVRTPRGRVDIVLRTKTTLYVMELKLDKSAGEAMEQIDLKNYPERFALCGLPVVKVAVCFDSERCTIGDWEIIGC
ncbi:ATP-binding protein [Bacteroides ovatus]|uniref:ATP-binding protein n=8 Tax=Bacteroides TaxID=816 RepID=A0AAP9DPR4_BACOV|nr:ATP-binding protein [Bacteroides ovatus]MCE8904893.1 ATP-binding protein [Bacteroides ovatus]MCE8946018.1 ATP-binding protein [Bacteroides ovatus]MCS2381020.1 ATP-binding protein [Bacteroides ovatus]MCS2572079.1 ATP-binding protein [Bacteroides ovatus]MCS2678662.1 ATP-binding protein [Bacteroides ovatus]